MKIESCGFHSLSLHAAGVRKWMWPFRHDRWRQFMVTTSHPTEAIKLSPLVTLLEERREF